MTNRTDMVSPDALVLTHALEKLRARDGLTHSRLENSRSVEAAPLLSLAAVRRYAVEHGEGARLHEAQEFDCLMDGAQVHNRRMAWH